MKFKGLRHLAGLSALVVASASGTAMAQNYFLPDAPGKDAVTNNCVACHAIGSVSGHRRAPHQWTEVVDRMIGLGAKLSSDQRKTIIAYLTDNWSQPQDYIKPPAPPKPARPAGPGLALALEAAQTAQEACRAKGYKVITLVVDSAGNTLVYLVGDGADLDLLPYAAGKTATVLKYKTSSGAVLKRMDTDRALIAEAAADPKIGEVRQGGLPIMAGGKIVGAIAVSGDFGPTDKDEVCAQVGLDKIASRLR